MLCVCGSPFMSYHSVSVFCCLYVPPCSKCLSICFPPRYVSFIMSYALSVLLPICVSRRSKCFSIPLCPTLLLVSFLLFILCLCVFLSLFVSPCTVFPFLSYCPTVLEVFSLLCPTMPSVSFSSFMSHHLLSKSTSLSPSTGYLNLSHYFATCSI